MGLPDWADYIQDGVNTNRIHQLSPILVYHWQPALFRHGVNLFHFRDIFVSDIDDVLRDICYVFLRTNMLCRKFSKCSINIKIHLFKSDSDCLPRHSRIVRMHLLHILVLKLTQQKVMLYLAFVWLSVSGCIFMKMLIKPSLKFYQKCVFGKGRTE